MIAAPQVLFPDGLRGPGWVEHDRAVTGCGLGPPARSPDVQFTRGYLVPGLVDLQVNGAFGADLAAADLDGWVRVMEGLPRTGVTSFVPTFITAPVPELVGSMQRFGELAPVLESVKGATPLGLHLEGPFLAETRRGAHPRDELRTPTPAATEALLEAAHERLLYVTLAPELDGASEAIRDFVAAGVHVAVGHSDATDVETLAAFDRGAQLVTHLFNAQSPLSHRAPGVVGAALADPRPTLGLIVDGHHVSPTAVQVAFAAAAERIALVTDATSALGMPTGVYELGGSAVHVVEGRPPIRADGTLAGSALRLDQAVRNAVDMGIPLEVALRAATSTPAEALGRHDLGRIVAGARADLVWLDDDLEVRRVWIGGREVDLSAGPASVPQEDGGR
jgi:N-acetylglucosamine-6-phosphate deacetylase